MKREYICVDKGDLSITVGKIYELKDSNVGTYTCCVNNDMDGTTYFGPDDLKIHFKKYELRKRDKKLNRIL
jgi:L-2-hydroxyglutarate oxidase LhgO